MEPTPDDDRPSIDALADRIFAAIEDGDVETITSMWADDVEVWHNNDGVVQTKAQNLAVMKWMIGRTASIEYRDVQRTIGDTGFVQRHVLRLTFDEGRSAEIPAAIFVEVRDQQVVRIDEYLDSAQAAAAFSR
ncbi:MAG: nuclear transport factor 2 family protein [Ilumatobacter sp.]|uniref:nuclear transport factor 2 family protein n=1 Tax=Ilumatobacter sp. TaxID=1967498 RepID=UPI003296EFCE